MDVRHHVALARKLARRLQEELLALDEIEIVLGELPPELVEQRERTKKQLKAIDAAIVVVDREAAGARL